MVVVAGGLVRARDPCASCALEISRVETRFADAVPPHISAFLSSQLLALARLPPRPAAAGAPPPAMQQQQSGGSMTGGLMGMVAQGA